MKFFLLFISYSSLLFSNTFDNKIYINGNFYTVNSKQLWAKAIVIKKGIIEYIGDDEGALKYQKELKVKALDLEGSTVLPGFHDTHLHPLEASTEYGVSDECLFDQTKNMRQIKRQLKICSKAPAQGGWVLGWGFDLDILMNADESPRDILNRYFPNRPVAIMEITSHSIWVNDKALDIAKIKKSSPHPQGGIYLKEEDGSLSGILLDNAGNLIMDLAIPKTEKVLNAHYKGLIKGLRNISRNGITSIVDARTYWKRGYHKVWQRVNRDGKLTARTILSLWAYPNEDDAHQLKMLKSLYSNSADSLLRISQIKFYNDGIIHNRTAAMLMPYKYPFPEVGSRGLNYFTKERLAKYTTELEKVGFDMHIHALGNRGVQERSSRFAVDDIKSQVIKSTKA